MPILQLPSPNLEPTGNYVSTSSTYHLKAYRKTPTINPGTLPNVRRVYPIDIPIGDIAVTIRRKLLCGVVATIRIFVCTTRIEF